MPFAATECPTPVLGSLDMIRVEYQEMPGLSLTRAQVQRMWSLDEYVCDALLDALTSARVLRRTAAGAYVAYGSSR